MKPPETPNHITRIVNRMRYSTETATLLAGDDYWDGHNYERKGRNTFLYRTPNGRYFVVTLTTVEGEMNELRPLTDAYEAAEAYDYLTVQRVSYQEAFPDIEITEA